MNVAALLAAAALTITGVGALPLEQSERSSDSPREAFTRLVQDYQMYVTPLCAPVVAVAYRRFNDARNRAFVQSLAETELQSRYRASIRAWNEQERRTVRHCEGPPPPPPPPGSTPPQVDRRDFAIGETQTKLRDQADKVPRHFDGGDRIFARMVALRDEIIGNRAE